MVEFTVGQGANIPQVCVKTGSTYGVTADFNCGLETWAGKA